MWRTARSEDAESCGNHPGATDSLTGAVKTSHMPASDSFRSRGGDRVNEQGLDQQARGWPTPKAMTGGKNSKRLERRKLGGGQGGADLEETVANWPTPQNRDFRSGVSGAIAKKNSRPLSEVASQSFLRARTTSQPGKNFSPPTRQLNPRFVEMLMGLPLGWTSRVSIAYAPSEMVSSRSARRWPIAS
jgi:hypothetical protein